MTEVIVEQPLLGKPLFKKKNKKKSKKKNSLNTGIKQTSNS